MSAAIVAIPALRALCLQIAVVIMFILVTSIFGITCLISFDVRRKRSKRIDIFCCVPSEELEWPCSKNHQCLGTCTIDSQMHQFNPSSEFPTSRSSNELPVSNLNLIFVFEIKNAYCVCFLTERIC